MDSDAQLRAHAGAPSNRKDDDRYRAQLTAYLTWDPRPRATLPFLNANASAEASTEHDVQVRGSDPEQERSLEQHDSAGYIEDTQMAYTALESQLFASSGTKRVSPSGRAASSKSTPLMGIPEDRIPDSIVRISEEPRRRSACLQLSQSSYLVSPFIGRSSKRARLDVNLQTTADSRAKNQLIQRHGKAVANLATTTIALKVSKNTSADGSHDSNGTASDMPTSYSFSEGNSGSLKRLPPLLERSISDPGPGAAEAITSASPFQALPNKGRPVAGAKDTDDNANTVIQIPTTRTPSRPTEPTASQIAALEGLSAEIWAPEPEVGLERPTSQLTSTLQHLAKIKHISFQPLGTSRKLEPTERGHWRLDCSAWPVDLQIDFWNYLSGVIGRGKAGWGVWCSREQETNGNLLHGPESPTVTAGIGVVKVFCWGEVIKHIYLLLYVASKSKVRKMGLQWFDSESKVVVQMKH